MNKTILVNKNNPIKERYFNTIYLADTNNINGETVSVESETLSAFNKLKEFLLTYGIEIGIITASKNYDKQNLDSTTICDEHITGLAIDFSIKVDGVFLSNINDIIKNKEKYERVYKYLSDYGFILRYPEGKEIQTNHENEIYHIRYVGKFIAKLIEQNNYTLEEYLSDFSGVIVVNKKRGMTSFDIVNEISHLFGIKKVGHTGTLDPLAEGVLIVAIGKATKIVELLTAKDKEYIAEVQLGIKTDTYDIEGNILAKKEVPNNLDIKNTLLSFKKTYLQEVPIYSAVKVNGKKLYEYARNNENVELPKKEVTVKEIELLEQTNNTFKFKVLVTKGCYIRSLINDIAFSLDNYGIMTSLLRTKQGIVTLDDSYTLDDIKNGNYKVYSIEEVLDYPIINVDDNLANKIKNGVKIVNTYNIEHRVIFKYNNRILGIYEKDNNQLRVWKNF